MKKYDSIDKETMDLMYHWLNDGYKQLLKNHCEVLSENEQLRREVKRLEHDAQVLSIQNNGIHLKAS